MRIISGQFKGRRLTPPRNLPVRPTTDMAKEALFNILNHNFYFDEIVVLDLFAGTGSISYEFASRGTETIISVDSDAGCVNYITETAESFEMPIQAIRSDVFSYLEKTTQKFNVIFADPPYEIGSEEFSKIPEAVFAKDILEHDGLLIIEHAKHTDLSHLLNYSHSKNYGGCIFSFFDPLISEDATDDSEE